MDPVEEALHVRGLIDKAILEKGEDYRYQKIEDFDYGMSMCNYLEYEDNIQRSTPIGPGCLVGHVLMYDGMSVEELMEKEGTGATSVVPYSQRVNAALGVLQTEQDKGETWLEARKAYDCDLAVHLPGYLEALGDTLGDL